MKKVFHPKLLFYLLILVPPLIILSCAHSPDQKTQEESQILISRQASKDLRFKSQRDPMRDSVTPPQYTLGPSDIVNIMVEQDKNLNLKAAKITDRGTIRLGYAGEVAIQDLSVEQAEQKIKTYLEKEYLRSADVHIQIVSYGSKMVKVYGEVQRPGTHALRFNEALISDVVSLAGGKTAMASDVAYVIRDYIDQSPFKIIKEKINSLKIQGLSRKHKAPLLKTRYQFFEASQADGLKIQSGDFIFIPPSFKITIVGEVMTEGTYHFTEKPDIVKAIASAHGFKKSASKSNITVKRKTPSGILSLSINYDDFINDDSETFQLFDGDVIVVPESWF